MNIAYDFALFLTSVVIITGLISALDILLLAKKRAKENAKMPLYIEYSRSFFPVLLLVLLIRSFLFQPYRVPTGSLEPTVLPGDFIIVNQFAYGLRLPILNNKIVNIGEPKRGDITLFRWPKNESIIFVKRVIGIPGDHIVYKDKELYVNGEKFPQEFRSLDLDIEGGMTIPVVRKLENVGNLQHEIFVRANDTHRGDFDITVPIGEYFMMGDNRDDSDDSRDWGFVPERDLIGKAFGIWMSFDSEKIAIRWNRIGKAIH